MDEDEEVPARARREAVLGVLPARATGLSQPLLQGVRKRSLAAKRTDPSSLFLLSSLRRGPMARACGPSSGSQVASKGLGGQLRGQVRGEAGAWPSYIACLRKCREPRTAAKPVDMRTHRGGPDAHRHAV